MVRYTLERYTVVRYILVKYTVVRYTLERYTVVRYTLERYTVGKVYIGKVYILVRLYIGRRLSLCMGTNVMAFSKQTTKSLAGCPMQPSCGSQALSGCKLKSTGEEEQDLGTHIHCSCMCVPRSCSSSPVS